MSTIWKRALATTTIALVAGLGLTACGSGGNTDDGNKGTQSQEQKKEEPKASGVMTADDFSQRINDAQMKAKSTHFTQVVEASGQKLEVTGDMVVDKDPSKVKMVMSMPGGMEIRFVDGEMYMNMGQMTGDKFYHATGEQGGALADQLSKSVEQANVAEQLETFKAALKDFKAEENAETIDGVETNKYTLVLDTKKLFEAQETEIPEGANLGDTLEYVIYAGEDDLPRRMEMDIAGNPMTMEFSKWGEEVSIEAPPADQITDQAPGM